MALVRRSPCLLVGFFALLCVWVDAQAFLAEDDGTRLSVGVPDTLSTACQTALNQTTQCNSTLSFIAFDGLFPSSDVLAAVCTDSCQESLQSFRSQEVKACGDEYYHIDGQLVPASYSVDQLLFTYAYTCLQDGTTDAYCAPLIDEWSQAGPTAEQSCSECMLKTFQVELNSPFGYDDEFASYYTSLTSSCSVSDYPITSPPPYTATNTSSTSTTTSATPSISCAFKYTVKERDDCSSVSQTQKVSEAMLRYNNEIAADCSNFPDAGTSLCQKARFLIAQADTAKGKAIGVSITVVRVAVDGFGNQLVHGKAASILTEGAFLVRWGTVGDESAFLIGQ